MRCVKAMILVSVFLFGGVVLADANKTVGLKIGYVDMKRALMSTKAGQKVDQQLQSEYKKKQKEIGAKEEDLKTMVQNFKEASHGNF